MFAAVRFYPVRFIAVRSAVSEVQTKSKAFCLDTNRRFSVLSHFELNLWTCWPVREPRPLCCSTIRHCLHVQQFDDMCSCWALSKNTCLLVEQWNKKTCLLVRQEDTAPCVLGNPGSAPPEDSSICIYIYIYIYDPEGFHLRPLNFVFGLAAASPGLWVRLPCKGVNGYIYIYIYIYIYTYMYNIHIYIYIFLHITCIFNDWFLKVQMFWAKLIFKVCISREMMIFRIHPYICGHPGP